MAPSKLVRFDEALSAAERVISEKLPGWAPRTVLVRDVFGKIRAAVDDRGQVERLPTEVIGATSQALDAVLGGYSPGVGAAFLLASEMVAPDELFGDRDITANPQKRVRVLDRLVTGADWSRAPFPATQANRLTLYGVKGGVGRSTAAAVLCWRLAQANKRVLVFDLDLESPGVGTTLLPPEREPDFGIVDWFVEDAVGQADAELARNMVASSPLGQVGEVLVVPAGGRSRPGYSYLSKLSRCYGEVPRDGTTSDFADRLRRLIEQIEAAVSPHVTIIDSRAGLHDIAAVAVTRLNAVSLLFGFDNSQTWRAYEDLFETWKSDPARTAEFRENLKTVAALVPETETQSYLDSFTENAYRLFEEYLYEEAPPGEEADYSFDVKDPEAPHTPLRVNWSRSIQQFDPVRKPGAVTDEQITAAFGDFVREVALMLFGKAET